MEEEIIAKFRRKKLKLSVIRTNFFSRFSGLMFKTKETKNLLFEFSNDVSVGIHSLFVFFSFLVVWLDERNRVLDFQIVKPFCFYIKPKVKYRKFIEIPLNEKNEHIINKFKY